MSILEVNSLAEIIFAHWLNGGCVHEITCNNHGFVVLSFIDCSDQATWSPVLMPALSDFFFLHVNFTAKD